MGPPYGLRGRRQVAESSRIEPDLSTASQKEHEEEFDESASNCFSDAHRSDSPGESGCDHGVSSSVQSAVVSSAQSPHPSSPIGLTSNIPTVKRTSTPTGHFRYSSWSAGGLSGHRYTDDPRWPNTPDEPVRSTMPGCIVHKYH